MNKSRRGDSRPVYSTDGGRLCPACGQSLDRCRCRAGGGAAAGDGIIRLHRESKGRGGKPVTLVRGVPLAAGDLKALASQLKKKLGSGGSLKGDVIEIQGDRREELRAELEKMGFRVKIAGG